MIGPIQGHVPLRSPMTTVGIFRRGVIIVGACRINRVKQFQSVSDAVHDMYAGIRMNGFGSGDAI